MAKGGEPRPQQKKHPLGKVVVHYTSEKSICYDKEFGDKILVHGTSRAGS